MAADNPDSSPATALLQGLTAEALRQYVYSRQTNILQYELAIACNSTEEHIYGAASGKHRRRSNPEDDGQAKEKGLSIVNTGIPYIDSVHECRLNPVYPTPTSDRLRYPSSDNIRLLSRLIDDSQPPIYDVDGLDRAQLLSIAQHYWRLDHPHLTLSELGLPDSDRPIPVKTKAKEASLWDLDIQAAFCEKLRGRPL